MLTFQMGCSYSTASKAIIYFQWGCEIGTVGAGDASEKTFATNTLLHLQSTVLADEMRSTGR